MPFLSLEGKLFKFNSDGSLHGYMHPFVYRGLIIITTIVVIFSGYSFMDNIATVMTWKKDACTAEQKERGLYTVVCVDQSGARLMSDALLRRNELRLEFPIAVFWKSMGDGKIMVNPTYLVYVSVLVSGFFLIFFGRILFWVLYEMRTLAMSEYRSSLKKAKKVDPALVTKIHKIKDEKNGRSSIIRGPFAFFVTFVILGFLVRSTILDLSIIKNPRISLCVIDDVQQKAATDYIFSGSCNIDGKHTPFIYEQKNSVHLRKYSFFNLYIEDIGKKKYFFVQEDPSGGIRVKLVMKTIFSVVALVLLCGLFLWRLFFELKKFFKRS